ncbi:uncharacterized protein [Macrobrachium rosenbergii]
MTVGCNEGFRGSDEVTYPSYLKDGAQKNESSNPDLDSKEISGNLHIRSGLSVFKKPGIAVEKVNSSVVHPDNIGEFSCTPKYNNVAKVLLNGQLLSSERRPLSASQFSSGSQKSGKSSEHSALTSTPIENSRIRSFSDTCVLWDNEENKAISPVQREESKLSRAFSPGAFQSPLSNDLKTLSLKSKKSGDNPSTVSTYHTCKSSCFVSSMCTKNTPCLLKGKDFEKQKAVSSSAVVPSDECLKCNRLELKNDPLKTAIIPAFDASGELDSLSPSDKSLHTSCDGGPSSKALISHGTVPKSSTKIVSDTGGVSSNMLHEISTNISSRKAREINSFLSHPGIGVSLRKRRQKRKYSVNKVKPLPLVKRLTRQSVRVSEMQKSQAEKNCMIQNENGNTDDSTTTEPSFFRARGRPPNLKKRQPTVAVQFNTRKMSSLRMAVADSSRDSLASSRENFALSRSASKPLEVLNRRTSRRVAIKGKTELQPSSYSRKELRSTDESMSSRSVERVFVSTRLSLRKSHDINKKLNSSSIKSKNSDIEESKFSIASKITVSEGESLYSTSDEKEFSGCEDIEEESAVSIESSVVLANVLRNQIEEESEDNHMTEGDIPETSDVRQTGNSIIAQKKPSDMSVTNDCGMSNHDISLHEGFDNQFKITMLSKRGKGWIRSLSIARASLYGSNQFGDIRRKTVHRMSVGRRITHFSTPGFEASWSSIKEEGCYNQQGDYLSQSILEDPQRHVLALCSQTEPVPITDCFTESRLSCCRKIGEGVYGEVFMTKPNPHNMDGATVLKIMPIEGDFEVNGEPQKHFSEILSEIIISLELSNLQKSKEEQDNWTENFAHVLNCWCVKGSYHQDMLHLWDIFHEEKGSENDRPDIFPNTQLHIVLEFTHGGRDLEGFVFNNAGQAHAIFLQIAYTLAVAEQELEFEHRDLHWGNVLIATTTKNYVEFKLNEGTYCLETKGVVATVIDFTLSRLKTPQCVMYNNLAEDPSLFTAEGDYQFEIYRQMKKVNGNNWEKFTPYTNILWLHYVVDKMINECYYKNVKSRIHKSGLALLRNLKDTILDSESAVDFVLRREHPE